MTRAATALVVSIFFMTSSARAETQFPFPPANDRIVIPADSPVQYSALRKENDGQVASFHGKFRLTGTYHFGDNDFNDSGDENSSKYIFDPQAYIIPDAGIAARLPHFVHRTGHDAIFLRNPVAFAKAVVSKQDARRVRCRGCAAATGHIAIWVDQFSAAVECDSPFYEARFLSVDKLSKGGIIAQPGRAC
jgi:hypothetical protein